MELNYSMMVTERGTPFNHVCNRATGIVGFGFVELDSQDTIVRLLHQSLIFIYVFVTSHNK